MIKTRKEYEAMLAHLEQEDRTLAEQRRILDASGLHGEQLEAAMEPLVCFNEQLREEVETYEQIMGGDFSRLENFDSIGRLLIALRIGRKMSQRELAIKLGLSESQVSRDEADEYHGATLKRLRDVLHALGIRLVNKVTIIEDQGTAAV